MVIRLPEEENMWNQNENKVEKMFKSQGVFGSG